MKKLSPNTNYVVKFIVYKLKVRHFSHGLNVFFTVNALHTVCRWRRNSNQARGWIIYEFPSGIRDLSVRQSAPTSLEPTQHSVQCVQCIFSSG
jgi:hypothetical protein